MSGERPERSSWIRSDRPPLSTSAALSLVEPEVDPYATLFAYNALAPGIGAFSRPRGPLWMLHGDNLMHGEPGGESRRRRLALPLALPEALVASAHTVGLTLSRIHALLRALESEITEKLLSSALGTLALEYDVRDAVDDRSDRPRRRARLHLHLGSSPR